MPGPRCRCRCCVGGHRAEDHHLGHGHDADGEGSQGLSPPSCDFVGEKETTARSSVTAAVALFKNPLQAPNRTLSRMTRPGDEEDREPTETVNSLMGQTAVHIREIQWLERCRFRPCIIPKA